MGRVVIAGEPLKQEPVFVSPPSLTRTVCPGEWTAGVANDSGFLGRAGLNKHRMLHSLPAGPSVLSSVGPQRSYDVTFGSKAVILDWEFYHEMLQVLDSCGALK